MDKLSMSRSDNVYYTVYISGMNGNGKEMQDFLVGLLNDANVTPQKEVHEDGWIDCFYWLENVSREGIELLRSNGYTMPYD